MIPPIPPGYVEVSEGIIQLGDLFSDNNNGHKWYVARVTVGSNIEVLKRIYTFIRPNKSIFGEILSPEIVRKLS